MITTDNNKTLESMYLDTTGMEMIPIKVLGDYRENGASGFVDAGTLSPEETKEIMLTGIAAVNEKGDGWNNPALLGIPGGGACSSCIKKLEDGTVTMGRNMDLPIGFAPVLLFRTKGNGKDTYDTVNLGYSSPGEISFDQVAELGAIPKALFASMAVGVTDVLNSEGLYVQYNMRESELCPTSSTNPNGRFRTCCITLNRLLGDHCATIEEALAYLADLDIYDPRCTIFDWSMAIGMMDRTGRYGVCEFVNNRIIWHEGRPGFACGQGNFYWDKEGFRTAFGAGYGRWQKLMEHYNGINTVDDMEKAIQHIWYSNLFTDGSATKDWKVNWMSEMLDKHTNHVREILLRDIYFWRETYGIEVDEKELKRVEEIADQQEKEGITWDMNYVGDPANYYNVLTTTDLYTKCFQQLPNAAKKMSGMMEASTISYVADTKNLGFRLHIFETNDLFRVGLYETTVERHPTALVHGAF